MIRLALCTFLFFPAVALAVSLQPVEQESSFAIDFWEEAATTQDLYGTLNGFPHTFQFVADENELFRAELMVADEALQSLSLILIKEEKRGVSEVGRVTGKEAEWKEQHDDALGLSFVSSGVFERTLDGGVYRLEVSAPDNTGDYRLLVGTESDDSGYFTKVRNAFVAHSHFGSGWFGAIRSPYVYLTLLALLSGWGLWYLKRRRRK